MSVGKKRCRRCGVMHPRAGFVKYDLRRYTDICLGCGEEAPPLVAGSDKPDIAGAFLRWRVPESGTDIPEWGTPLGLVCDVPRYRITEAGYRLRGAA